MGLADTFKVNKIIIEKQIQDIIDKKSTKIVIGKDFVLSEEQWQMILSLSDLTHLEIIGRPLGPFDHSEVEKR